MKDYRWKPEKNEWLKANRNICFEDAVFSIENGNLIGITKNPNQERYPDQNIFILIINSYVYLVPYSIEPEYRFLHTMIPSRKYTKIYLGGKHE